MFQKYTDQQIMEAVRSGSKVREDAWRYITMNWGSYCCRTAIKRTKCDEPEARQAFSIACLGVDKRIRTTIGYDFIKRTSLKTYLTSATIRAALHVMGQRKKDPGDEGIKEEEHVRNWFYQKDCRENLEKALANIGERCKKVLLFFTDERSMKEITKEMGLGNEDVAKTVKWKCQERFKAYLRANPHVKNLLIENCYG